MNKFTFGMITGMSSLALAVPTLAQISSAQTEDVVFDAKEITFTTPSQECLEAMADLEEAQFTTFDANTAKRKEAIQSRIVSLREVAGIADEDARKEALEQMHEEMRAGFDGDEQPEVVTTAMEALKAACGDTPFMMGFGPHMIGIGHHGGDVMFTRAAPFPGKLAEQLGMSEEELKDAIESGKTIEDLAEEKGITLPVKGQHFMFKLSDELGMTEEEFKIELDSGKTIEEIAEEKGIELPAFDEMHKPGIRLFKWNTQNSSTESTEE